MIILHTFRRFEIADDRIPIDDGMLSIGFIILLLLENL